MPAFPARILVPVLLALSLLAPPARAKEQWVVVSMPHFRVLTTAPAATARKWALELERFTVMLHEVVNVPEAMVRPLTVVLFRTDRAMRPYKPLEKGRIVCQCGRQPCHRTQSGRGPR